MPVLRPVFVVLLSLALITACFAGAIRSILKKFILPVDQDDVTPICVIIPEGASASKIASLLYSARGADEEGLIASTAAFKIYVDFIGKANNLHAGQYYFSRNMSLSEIVSKLVTGPGVFEKAD